MHARLKGVCHEIFYPYFFMIRTHIWASDKQANIFSNSVSISPRYSITKWSPRFAAHCWDDLRGVHQSIVQMTIKKIDNILKLSIAPQKVEIFDHKVVSAVCCTLLRWSPRYASKHCTDDYKVDWLHFETINCTTIN